MRSLRRQMVGRRDKSFLADYPDGRADDVDIRIKHTWAACSRVAGTIGSRNLIWVVRYYAVLRFELDCLLKLELKLGS